MERPIKKDPGTLYTKLDTPSLILDLDAARKNLTLISNKLNSLKLKVRWNVNSHLTKDILSLQMKAVLNTKGISVANTSQASIFSSLSDDIIVNNVVLAESKLSSISELNASPTYSSILQLNKIKTVYSGEIYIKIKIDPGFDFNSDIINYLSNIIIISPIYSNMSFSNHLIVGCRLSVRNYHYQFRMKLFFKEVIACKSIGSNCKSVSFVQKDDEQNEC